MMCASGGGCHCWAFCDDLVKLKLARGGERFSWRRIRVCLHERLALSPLIEILFRSPVSHDNIVIALHRPQDFGFDESGRLCNVPFLFLPSLLEILFPPLRDRYSVRDDQDHGDPWRSVCILAIRARLLSISLSQQRTARDPRLRATRTVQASADLRRGLSVGALTKICMTAVTSIKGDGKYG